MIDKTKQISQGIGKGLGYLDDVIDLNQTFRGKGWGTSTMKTETKPEMKRTEEEIEEAELVGRLDEYFAKTERVTSKQEEKAEFP